MWLSEFLPVYLIAILVVARFCSLGSATVRRAGTPGAACPPSVGAVTLPVVPWVRTRFGCQFLGKAKAMISSLVTSDPVSPPPVLTTVTNCRPSAPR